MSLSILQVLGSGGTKRKPCPWVGPAWGLTPSCWTTDRISLTLIQCEAMSPVEEAGKTAFQQWFSARGWQSFWGLNDSLTGVTGDYWEKPRCFTLRFITVAALQPWSSNQNNFMVGVTTAWGTVLKGCNVRKVGNLCIKGTHEGTVTAAQWLREGSDSTASRKAAISQGEAGFRRIWWAHVSREVKVLEQDAILPWIRHSGNEGRCYG